MHLCRELMPDVVELCHRSIPPLYVMLPTIVGPARAQQNGLKSPCMQYTSSSGQVILHATWSFVSADSEMSLFLPRKVERG